MLELKQPYYDHLVIQSKKLLNFLTRRQYVGWISGQKESASKTNQEADDRLFWPMLLENQSRKRSTNGTIQEARKVAKNFQQQNIEVCTTTVWRYMTRKGWKAFTRKKIPLLSEKQRKARLRFAKKHAKLTAEDWDNFLFTDKCPKYLFHAVP